jgi:hypothetical protein
MSFKTFDLAHDVASLVSSINEVVTMSATLFYGAGETNVKTFTNIATASAAPYLGGYWQTVFDSAPTSQASTALFDITYGCSTGSSLIIPGLASGSIDEKTKVYREMASMLLGSPDARFTIGSGTKDEAFFILIKRGLMKDELKKGSVYVVLSGGAGEGSVVACVTASDNGAATSFKQTVGGDYAPLYSGSSTVEVAQVWYNAGVIVIPASGVQLPWSGSEYWIPGGYRNALATETRLTTSLSATSIDSLAYGLRRHIQKLNFHNQTNLYSTVYFCRATNTEFNYSSNPTYVDESQRIRVTSGSNVLQSRAYITTVGLYDANDNLLAVGKVNKPITKAPDTESIFRIRLDY